MPFADRYARAGKAHVQNTIIARHQLPVPVCCSQHGHRDVNRPVDGASHLGQCIRRVVGSYHRKESTTDLGWLQSFETIIQLTKHEIHVSVSLYFATRSTSAVCSHQCLHLHARIHCLSNVCPCSVRPVYECQSLAVNLLPHGLLRAASCQTIITLPHQEQ